MEVGPVQIHIMQIHHDTLSEAQCLMAHFISVPSQSLGLDLLPPSPQKSRDMSSPDLQHWQSHLSHLSPPHNTGTHTMDTTSIYIIYLYMTQYLVYIHIYSIHARSGAQYLSEHPESVSFPNTETHTPPFPFHAQQTTPSTVSDPARQESDEGTRNDRIWC